MKRSNGLDRVDELPTEIVEIIGNIVELIAEGLPYEVELKCKDLVQAVSDMHAEYEWTAEEKQIEDDIDRFLEREGGIK